MINAPLPSNSYITVGGLDWAWASPLPSDGGSFGSSFAIDLSFQGLLGWRLPTLAELVGAPSGFDFVFRGANVPLGGTDPVSGATFQAVTDSLTGAAACAAAYFQPNANYAYCDWSDGRGVSGNDWSTGPGEGGVNDQLLVRISGVDPIAPVPLPGAAGFLMVALAGLGLARKARKA